MQGGFWDTWTSPLPNCSGNTPGLYRDAPGHLNDTSHRFTDLVDTHGWGLRTIIVLVDVNLWIREIYYNIAGVSLRASDLNGYKMGKGQVTSQIEFCCLYEHRGQKSCTTSILTLRNGDAVTHHFSYDREMSRRWGLPVRQRRYWVRPWITQAEHE